MTRIATASTVAAALFSFSSTAAAHIALTVPAARYGQDEQKDGPCGMLGNPPGTNAPTELVAGDPLLVTWNEFVDHESHFRISISNTGDDAFLNPASFDDFYNSDTVILDEIPDTGQENYQVEIEVPDIDCNPCTLQLIQVMYGGTFSEGSLYYQCADIVIVPAGAGTSDGGESTGSADGSTGGAEESSSEGGATTSASASATGATTTSSTTDVDSTDATAESSSTDGEPADDDTSGCGCRTDRGTTPVAGLALLGAVFLGRRRRR